MRGIGLHIEGDVRHVQEVVGKTFLDDVVLIAATNNEIINAMVRVYPHDMPQDRLATLS